MGIFVYVVIRNYPIFGSTIELKEKEISALTPGSRIKKVLRSDSVVQKQLEDLIYFTTKSVGYDKAKVRVTYINGNLDQDILLGFKDKNDWHYKTKPVYLSLVDKIDWYRTDISTPALYQKVKTFNSFDEFIKNPPQDKVVGTYYLEDNYSEKTLDGYSPKHIPTKLEVPLRGSHTFYTYINSEPFTLKVSKQDLNWYEGEDKVKIQVSKNGKILTDKTIPDDGITDRSQKFKPPQSDEIKYEGGNPENGLYKINLIGGTDTIIKSIESSFSLLAFQGPIYLVSGSPAYNGSLVNGPPNVLFTDANKLTFRTFHTSSLQKIEVNGELVDINEADKDFEHNTGTNRNEIKIPTGDVIVNGPGYFSFAKEQFFTPYIYKKFEVKGKEDLDKVDYLLTDYVKPFNLDDDWRQSEIEFDLKDAIYTKDKLSWIIRAPGLKEKGNSILIKEIEVTLEKDPIFD